MYKKALLSAFLSLAVIFNAFYSVAPAHADDPPPAQIEAVEAVSCSVTVPNPVKNNVVVQSTITISCTGAVTHIHVTGILTKNSSTQQVMGSDCEGTSWCQVTVWAIASTGLWHAWGEGSWTDAQGNHTIPKKRSQDCIPIVVK